MTANKYNNKHHVVDEHKRDAQRPWQRRARAAAISEKNERDLHDRLLKVHDAVARARDVPLALTLDVGGAQGANMGVLRCVIARHVRAMLLKRNHHKVRRRPDACVAWPRGLRGFMCTALAS